MRVKDPNCQSLSLRASVSKPEDPHLSIDNQLIPLALEPVKFLGKSFAVPQHITALKQNLIRLQEMLDKTDSCPLSRKQNWLLTIEDLPIF